MKSIIVAILCFISISVFAQNEKVEFDGSKWNPPYSLYIPKGWDVERFLIPIEFAPQIPYHGVEDLRFTPDGVTQQAMNIGRIPSYGIWMESLKQVQK